MGVGDDRHEHRQRRFNGRDHIADSIHWVEYRAFRLSCGLSLHCLAGCRLRYQILGVTDGSELKTDNRDETNQSKMVLSISPIGGALRW